MARPRAVDEHVPHRLRRDAPEVAAILEALLARDPDLFVAFWGLRRLLKRLDAHGALADVTSGDPEARIAAIEVLASAPLRRSDGHQTDT